MPVDEPLYPISLRLLGERCLVASAANGALCTGHSSACVALVRRRSTDEFGPEYEVLMDLLAEARPELRARGVSTEGPGWQRALDSGMLDLIREGDLAEPKERLEACLSSSSD